jgi:hypothetical protein
MQTYLTVLTSSCLGGTNRNQTPSKLGRAPPGPAPLRPRPTFKKGCPMARIIVTADPTNSPDAPVLLEETVSSVHLSTGHAAAQLVERLAWAITDAETAELARSDRQATGQTRGETSVPM